ncbi:MAG: hypothetical protein AAF211_02245 [Myxococcota bacterium]
MRISMVATTALVVGCTLPVAAHDDEGPVFTRDDFPDLPPEDPDANRPPVGAVDVPATWCLSTEAMRVLTEEAMAPGFAVWDALVPDETLFTYAGSCEDEPLSLLQFDIDDLPPGIIANVNPGVPWQEVFRSDILEWVHSSVLEPDDTCDGDILLEHLVARIAGSAMYLPISCDGGNDPDCPREDFEAVMGPRLASCEAPVLTEWDIRQFEEVQGYTVER